MLLPSSPIADRLFSRRRHDTTAASSGSHSPTPWDDYSPTDPDCFSPTDSDSRFADSSDSRTSRRIRALLIQIKTTCSSPRVYTPRFFDCSTKDSHPPDAENVVSYTPICVSNSQYPSSWTANWPHECECTTRSQCPYFIQQHINYLQSHEWRCVPRILTSAYHTSVDEYAHASDALSLPSAKLARARAEHSWASTRQSDGTRLWAPRLQQQLLVAEAKIAAAEKDLEAANTRRWERAQLLMDIGRF